jgi:thioredoxin 1
LKRDFPDITVQNIDIHENLEIAAQHLVFAVPVVLLLFDNKEYYRFVKSFSVGEVLEKLVKMRALNQ